MEGPKTSARSHQKTGEGLSSVHIDKSLYIQDNNYRPGSKRKTSRSSSRGVHTTDREKEGPLPQGVLSEINLNNLGGNGQRAATAERKTEDFAGKGTGAYGQPIGFNQYLQQVDVIKEDVQKENMVSSFDNSHSHGFDLSSAPNLPY